MNILITGITGFVGKRLAAELQVRGHKIAGLVRYGSKVKDLPAELNLHIGDVTDLESMGPIFINQQAVFHLVGTGNISDTRESSYSEYYKINVEGTLNVLKQCVYHNIRRVIVFSSTAAMGLVPEGSNELTECKPVTPYQRSKSEMERVAIEYATKNNLELVILRPSMIYGPGAKSEILTLAKFIKSGIVPRIGDGLNIIPGIYIDDLVVAAANAISVEPGTYILTGPDQHTLSEFISLIAKSMKERPLILPVPKALAKKGANLIEFIFRQSNRVPPITGLRIDSMSANRKFDLTSTIECLKLSSALDFQTKIDNTINWYKHENLLD